MCKARLSFTIFMQIFLFTLLLTTLGFGQEDSLKTWRITMQDGSELVGNIVDENDEKIWFITHSGLELSIDRAKVVEIEAVKGSWKKGKFTIEDPNTTRLFFAPSAKTLEKGAGYFSIYEIFFPMLAIGITDFFTFSGGMSLFPGSDEQILYVAPKVRLLHTKEVDFSTGILYAILFDENFGIAYGVGTFQKSGYAVTGGMGWGFVDGDFSSTPVVMLGLEAGLSRRLKFISENWFVPVEDGGLLSFGLRFFGKYLAADFGLMKPLESTDGFPFLPWIGFTVNF